MSLSQLSKTKVKVSCYGIINAFILAWKNIDAFIIIYSHSLSCFLRFHYISFCPIHTPPLFLIKCTYILLVIFLGCGLIFTKDPQCYQYIFFRPPKHSTSHSLFSSVLLQNSLLCEIRRSHPEQQITNTGMITCWGFFPQKIKITLNLRIAEVGRDLQ